MNTKTLTCPKNSRFTVELDKSQVFEDDPGQGTPAMVYGPYGASGTLWCAAETGELSGGVVVVDVPADVQAWLNDEVLAEADAFLYPNNA